MDELIERLREPCQYENCILCQQAADAIEKLGNWLAQANKLIEMLEKPRWIPVTERLPEERQFVLAWKDEKPKGFACVSFWTDNAGWAFNNITHWMPLPTAPPMAEEGE